MTKVAIYVEGLTELAFVRQLLMEHYDSDWSKVRIVCINVGDKLASNEMYDFGDENAPLYYMIYNSQNDKKVISDICKNYTSHISKGFSRIVGLRDVFSEDYVDLYGHIYNTQGIKDLTDGMQKTIANISSSNDVKITFAIMEIEAWMISLSNVFARIGHNLSNIYNQKNYGPANNPETTLVHPFKELTNIFSSAGLNYSKHWNDIKNFIFKIKKADFISLYKSPTCNSFNVFVDAILK